RKRGDVDDCAAARGPDHGGYRMLREQEHGLDVDLHDASIVLGPLVDDAAAAADTDIVVEEVEPAPALDGGVDQPLAVRFVGDVPGMRHRGAAFSGNHRHGAFGEPQLAIGDDDPGPGARHQDRGGTPVADTVVGCSAAADDGDLTCETRVILASRHSVSPFAQHY